MIETSVYLNFDCKEGLIYNLLLRMLSNLFKFASVTPHVTYYNCGIVNKLYYSTYYDVAPSQRAIR